MPDQTNRLVADVDKRQRLRSSAFHPGCWIEVLAISSVNGPLLVTLMESEAFFLTRGMKTRVVRFDGLPHACAAIAVFRETQIVPTEEQLSRLYTTSLAATELYLALAAAC
jgi:hypothetical protein